MGDKAHPVLFRVPEISPLSVPVSDCNGNYHCSTRALCWFYHLSVARYQCLTILQSLFGHEQGLPWHCSSLKHPWEHQGCLSEGGKVAQSRHFTQRQHRLSLGSWFWCWKVCSWLKSYFLELCLLSSPCSWCFSHIHRSDSSNSSRKYSNKTINTPAGGSGVGLKAPEQMNHTMFLESPALEAALHFNLSKYFFSLRQ